MSVRQLLCLAFLVAAVFASDPRHTLGSEPISVHPRTLRLVDEHFREVYFHGVNVVVKGFPWIPETAVFDPLTSFSTKDMETLQQLGLNAIRLGTMWPGVEPVRGQYNATYIQALRTLVANAASYGIYSLLDMHQDVMSEKFCGEGVPLWAAVPEAVNATQAFPYPVASPYTVNSDSIPTHEECWSKSWSEYYITKAAGSAFQNLYDNNFGLRDSWASFWAEVASSLGSLGSAVLGYELMNEPWAGDAIADIGLMLPGVADRINLQPMWDIGASAIRAIDTSHAIFFEGVTWDWVNVGFTDVPGGASWRNKSVLSYHFYVPPDFSIDVQFAARQDDMQRLQCGGFLTESWVDGAVLEKCDQVFQSWLLWEYKPFVHNKTGWGTTIWNNDGTLNVPIASLLSRTYAQVVAGTSVALTYDNNTYLFTLVFKGDPLVTSNSTKIYLNEAMHYPNGYNVQATTSRGSQYVQWKSLGVNHIEVQHTLAMIGTNDTVSVVITAL